MGMRNPGDLSFMPQRDRDPATQLFESMTASQALLIADERDRLTLLICLGYDWPELIQMVEDDVFANEGEPGEAMREVASQAADAALEVLRGAFKVGISGPTI